MSSHARLEENLGRYGTHCVVAPRDKRVYRDLASTDFFL
jgi:hypothetical protein